MLVFLRLRSVLGRRTGSERPRLDPYGAGDTAAARDSKVMPLPRADRPAAVEQAPLNGAPQSAPAAGPALEQLREIAAADRTFDLASFLRGAKVAYEMIVAAYAKGDRETLHNLLSPEVFDSFSDVIAEREQRGELVEFSFVGITSADIVEAHLADRMAHITVKFISELITAVRDRSGNVIEGDPKAVRQVTDIWTFARDITSANPNWRLVATDSPEA